MENNMGTFQLMFQKLGFWLLERAGYNRPSTFQMTKNTYIGTKKIEFKQTVDYSLLVDRSYPSDPILQAQMKIYHDIISSDEVYKAIYFSRWPCYDKATDIVSGTLIIGMPKK